MSFSRCEDRESDPGAEAVRWSASFLAALVGAGVRDLVVSPGSRSGPLVLAAVALAERSERLRITRIIDERAAAFFALGQAKATGRPSMLLCTSGTAAAHYLPAAVEAAHSHTPMLIVTADRPWEARGVGANQTIDQLSLFRGTAVEQFALDPPSSQPAALRGLERAARRAYGVAVGARPGPVHINAPFRKPLEPRDADALRTLAGWQRALTAHEEIRPARGRSPEQHELAALARDLLASRRPLLIAGPDRCPDDAVAAARHATLERVAAALSLPCLIEATSQLRRHRGSSRASDSPADAAPDDPMLFLWESYLEALEAPDLVVELGCHTPISKAFATVAHGSSSGLTDKGPRRILISRFYRDAFSDADTVLDVDEDALLEALAACIESGDLAESAADARAAASRTAWLAGCRRQESEAAHRLRRLHRLNETGATCQRALTEAATLQAIVRNAPARTTLVIGNSCPVRDLDALTWPSANLGRVVHQRGASGIDGFFALAAGVRSVSEGPVILVLGDVAAVHDRGGWLACEEQLAEPGPPLVTVVIDNRGGQIFGALPVGRYIDASPQVESLFATPPTDTALDVFRPHAVSTEGDLEAAFAHALSGQGPVVLRAIVDPDEGTVQRRGLRKSLQACEPAPGGVVWQRPSRGPLLPCLFVHGFMGQPSMYDDVIAAMPEAQGALVARLPGHGLFAEPVRGTFDDAARAMLQALESALGDVSRAILVGYSMGGRLGLRCLELAPDRFAGALLIGARSGLERDQHTERAERAAWEEDLAMRIRTTGVRPVVDAWEELPLFASERALDPALRRRHRRQRLAHAPASLSSAATVLGLSAMEASPGLASYAGPLVWMAGEHDAKFRSLSSAAASRSPRGRAVVVPDAGHNVVLARPEAVADAIARLSAEIHDDKHRAAPPVPAPPPKEGPHAIRNA